MFSFLADWNILVLLARRIQKLPFFPSPIALAIHRHNPIFEDDEQATSKKYFSMPQAKARIGSYYVAQEALDNVSNPISPATP